MPAWFRRSWAVAARIPSGSRRPSGRSRGPATAPGEAASVCRVSFLIPGLGNAIELIHHASPHITSERDVLKFLFTGIFWRLSLLSQPPTNIAGDLMARCVLRLPPRNQISRGSEEPVTVFIHPQPVLPGQKFANGQNGSKYCRNCPDLGFTNGQLNSQLSVLYFALKWSNLEQKIVWVMCKDIRKINIPTQLWLFQSYERSMRS